MQMLIFNRKSSVLTQNIHIPEFSWKISGPKSVKICGDRCIQRSDFNFTRFEIVGPRIVIIGETEVRIYNPDILFENKIKLETNSNAKFDCSRKSYSFRLHKRLRFWIEFLWFLTNWIRTGYGDGKLCDNVITNVVGNDQGEGGQLWICGSNSRNPLLYQVNLGNNFHRKEYPALDFCPKSFNINRHGFDGFGHFWPPIQIGQMTAIIRTWPQTFI